MRRFKNRPWGHCFLSNHSLFTSLQIIVCIEYTRTLFWVPFSLRDSRPHLETESTIVLVSYYVKISLLFYFLFLELKGPLRLTPLSPPTLWLPSIFDQSVQPIHLRRPRQRSDYFQISVEVGRTTSPFLLVETFTYRTKIHLPPLPSLQKRITEEKLTKTEFY